MNKEKKECIFFEQNKKKKEYICIEQYEKWDLALYYFFGFWYMINIISLIGLPVAMLLFKDIVLSYLPQHLHYIAYILFILFILIEVIIVLCTIISRIQMKKKEEKLFG